MVLTNVVVLVQVVVEVGAALVTALVSARARAGRTAKTSFVRCILSVVFIPFYSFKIALGSNFRGLICLDRMGVDCRLGYGDRRVKVDRCRVKDSKSR